MEGENASKRRRTSASLCSSGISNGKIKFSEKIQGNLRVFEMPDSLVKETAAGSGHSGLELVGTASEEAVLCSASTTYSIKKVELSNQLYLLNEVSSDTLEIFGSACHIYELKPTRGRVENLLELLRGTEYPSVEGGPAPRLLTRPQVRSMVQASEAELAAAFARSHVVEVEGYVRVLRREALDLLTREVLDTVLEQGLDMTKLRELEDLRAHLSTGGEDGVDGVLLQHCLSVLGERTDGRTSTGAVWNLDPRKVQQASAHLLFLQHVAAASTSTDMASRRPWPMRDFFLTWEGRTPTVPSGAAAAAAAAGGATVPEAFVPSLELLKGIAITAATNKPDCTDVNHGLLYAPVNLLSTDPAVRIRQLFETRGRKTCVIECCVGAGAAAGVGAPSSSAAATASTTAPTRPKASAVLSAAAASAVAAPAEFTLDELTPYFTEFVGGTGQPKSVVELLLPFAKLANGVYTKK